MSGAKLSCDLFPSVVEERRLDSGGMVSQFVDLPVELYLEIFNYLSARDVVHTLSTCRTLQSFTCNEAIWWNLSSRDFGIDDLSPYQDHYSYTSDLKLSFHAVYTRFLYPFGPLLGLWASDHPFRGNVLEFRVMMKEEFPGLGIIGEVWRFPASQLAQDNMDPIGRARPLLPLYVETVYIKLQRGRSETSSLDEMTAEIVFPWAQKDNHEVLTKEKPSMSWLSKTTQSYFVWYGAGHADTSYALHPEFPPSHSVSWLDAQRRHPRLPSGMHHLEVYNNKATIPRFSNVMSLCGAPSEQGYVKPPALSMTAGPYAPFDLHHPAISGISDLRGFGHRGSPDPLIFGMREMEVPSGRYYPLRLPPNPSTSRPLVDEDDWTAQTLSGLWLASYGLFGTQVLFLEWDADHREVRAWKITGDVGVPRGIQSWHFTTDLPITLEDRTRRVLGPGITPNSRAYGGFGIVSDRGFTPDVQRIKRLEVVIVSTDEIRIRWGGAERVFCCTRYIPRDIRAEVKVREGARCAPDAAFAWKH